MDRASVPEIVPQDVVSEANRTLREYVAAYVNFGTECNNQFGRYKDVER